MTVDAYVRQLKELLPPGSAWNLEPSSVLSQLLAGLSEELARIDLRAGQVIEESDPRTALETFADWERVYGLPDPCVGGDPSLAQRRASLLAKILSIGGQTPAYYIAVAAALGYTITITEFVTPYEWQVNAPLNTVGEFTVEDDVDQPLAWWGNAALECVLTELKPAHTTVVFAYT